MTDAKPQTPNARRPPCTHTEEGPNVVFSQAAIPASTLPLGPPLPRFHKEKAASTLPPLSPPPLTPRASVCTLPLGVGQRRQPLNRAALWLCAGRGQGAGLGASSSQPASPATLRASHPMIIFRLRIEVASFYRRGVKVWDRKGSRRRARMSSCCLGCGMVFLLQSSQPAQNQTYS